jgi:hypothetical protein
MRILIVASVLAALALGGCAANPMPYGTFTGTSTIDSTALTSDIVAKLVVDYPPAHTRLNLGQPTQDAFGMGLVAALREKGYAVAEFGKQDAANEVKPRDELHRAAHPYFFHAPAPAQASVDMRYVVDQLGVDNLYRVTIWLGDKSLSRAYVAQGSELAPAGAWVRKE